MHENKSLIMIVEDDEDMAQLNARLLRRHGYGVLVAFTAADARTIAADSRPDMFVLDIELPDGNGLSLCREFRRSTDAPVLFLTGRAETPDKVTGLRNGGDYYLTKPYDKNEFLAIIQSLLRRMEQTRKNIDDAFTINRGSITLKVSERKAYVDGRDAGLTPKEFAVLLILIQNEDIEVPYETIYERVWGMAMNNDVNALRQQILRLRKKLNEENTDGFSIVNGHRKGYTFTTM